MATALSTQLLVLALGTVPLLYHEATQSIAINNARLTLSISSTRLGAGKILCKSMLKALREPGASLP